MIKKWVLFLSLFVSCAVSKPPVVVPPSPIPAPAPKPPEPVKIDTIHQTVTLIDTFKTANTPAISVTDFGAKPIAGWDSYKGIQNAIDSAIVNHIAFVRVPVGIYYSSHSILFSFNGQFFSVTLLGDAPSKSAPTAYVSQINFGFTSGFGIGIQLGRGITIENLTIIGMYKFPQKINNANIGTLTWNQWNDSSVVDSRLFPYAGISIDPYQNANGSNGGTSDVTIRNCSIRNWMVGIALSPNGYTANDEMINIDNDDIESVRDCIAIGQDQSKTISITGLKVWGQTHTVLDGLNYGNGTGGGSVFCENWNIAGQCEELFNLVNDRFPLSAKDIYSESLFKIGTLGGSAGAECDNFEIDFLSGPGWPAADFLIQGGADFHGGMLRFYDSTHMHRPNFVNTGSTFSHVLFSNPPITVGLYGAPQNVYPVPEFDHIHLYTPGTFLKPNYDTLIRLPNISVTVNQALWTASYGSTGVERVGDYILGAGRGCLGTGLAGCPTSIYGRVIKISDDSVYLDDVAVNSYTGKPADAFYIDRIK